MPAPSASESEIVVRSPSFPSLGVAPIPSIAFVRVRTVDQRDAGVGPPSENSPAAAAAGVATAAGVIGIGGGGAIVPSVAALQKAACG